jgi:hypothetical protein
VAPLGASLDFFGPLFQIAHVKISLRSGIGFGDGKQGIDRRFAGAVYQI